MTELGQTLDNVKGVYADKVIVICGAPPSSSSGEMPALPRSAKMGLYTVKFGNSVDGDVATVVLWACLR